MLFTVMIIDDEKTVREGIKELIDWEAAGFRLGSCGKDGREGLANILRENPDLVLIDIKMPGLNGLEVIQEAKKLGFNGHFLILTGFSEFEYAKSAISMGVDGYLLKPIDEDELLEYTQKIRRQLEEDIRLSCYHKQNRKEMGETFNNSLDMIRITNARRLLEETNLKVYQISEMVGYSSIDYFYMKFKKYVGISPKEYRKNTNLGGQG